MALFLSFLLAISLFVRTIFLPVVPPELFGDEVDVGYQAYSLLHTGRDLQSQPLPFYIHSLAEWRAPVLIYATVPTIAIFGNNIWGVRSPEIAFGSLAPIILFLLVFELTHNKKLSVFSSLALAFLPWHILYSRAAFEVVILLDFIMLGTLLYLKKSYYLALFLFVLTFYTYSTAVVFTPLWLGFLFFSSKKKPDIFPIAFSVILFLPFVLNLISGHAQERFSTMSIINNSQTLDAITVIRKVELSPVFHNKFESYLGIFVTNYFRSFSTDFLFVRGDPTMRHSIQYIGQLLPVTAPFLLLGLYYLLKNKQYFWLIWLAIAPVPSSLTLDGSFHATRLFLMIPPLCVAIGAGFFQLKKLFLAPAVLALLVEFIFVGHFYIVHYPANSWRWWQTGYQELFTSMPSTYPRIFINNTYEPALIRFLFYTSYSPSRFQHLFTGDKLQTNIAAHYDGFTLDGRYFFGTFSPNKNKPFWETLQPDSLYVISQRDDIPGDWDWRITPPSGVRVISTITNPFNQPVFYVITKN